MAVRDRDTCVYISGVHSGPNPSPGVGVARSLRAAYPELRLVGVDYSVRSSGLHWPDFDRIWLQRPWPELDLHMFRDEVEGLLAGGGLWISGLDLEAALLGRELSASPRLLAPRPEAIAATAKPCVEPAGRLGVRVPDSLPMSAPHQEWHRFCRRHGWRVWVKGPNYEARRVLGWHDLRQVTSEMETMWSTDHLHLQQDVAGNEESIAFAAVGGRVCGTCRMEKRLVTPEGKTWAGRVTSTPESLEARLRALVAELEWTGGAELEFIRAPDGGLWLLEWNPRFPAWVHGATICGVNLPAMLVAQAGGLERRSGGRRETRPDSEDPSRRSIGAPGPPHDAEPAREFVRVVLEIPARDGYSFPPLPEPSVFDDDAGSGAKHPSGMPQLAKRLHRAVPGPDAEAPEPAPAEVAAGLAELALDALPTPHPVFLSASTRARWARSAGAVASLPSGPPAVRLAYSMKTNPSPALLALAREHGLLVEAISQAEVELALRSGFSSSDVVLNGPGKSWPRRVTGERLFAVFADSVEELESMTGTQPSATYVGVRLRQPQAPSRFGAPVEPYAAFERLAGAVASLPRSTGLAVHFHMASSAIGVARWWSILESALEWARALEHASERRVACLDLGGGWFPEDWDDELLPALSSIRRQAQSALGALETVVLEPGKALAQRSVAIVSRVLEVRASMEDRPELVVDASVAELPEAASYPHQILHRAADGRWARLRRGRWRVVGRICMEDDVLADDVAVPATVRAGDVIAICDAGAYDRSMAYAFARG